MDTKLQVSILREHSEHIRRLSITMSEALTKFEQAVSKSAGSAATDGAGLLDEVTNLNNSLFAAADIFYKRLGNFVETRKKGSGSTSEN